MQYQYASGKNTSDIALTLDALEALFDRRADTFCLVTSDSDCAFLCRKLPFSPCVEIGWRLKRSAWGRGYATERAKECLRVGFDQLGLDEIVSFTTSTNLPSIAVMKRIGMSDAQADFEHPAVPEGSPLRPHCLYNITRAQWMRRQA